CRGGCFPLFVDGTTGVVRNLTIERGLVGIRNTGTLTVANSHFINNGGPGGGPGGIKNMGTLDVKHSTFSSSVGGGIENNGGTLIVSRSTIVSNIVGHPSFFGGGIYNSGTLTVDGSFIIGNTALGGGGGIYTCCGGTLTLHRTLVTDNIPDDIVP